MSLGIALVAGAAAAQAPRRTAVSSFELRDDAKGCPLTVVTNARFLHVDDGDSDGLLLRETVTIRHCLRAEGKDAQLVAEVWPARAALTASPRFVIRTPGESGELSEGGLLYRVLEAGCCGTGDLWHYFSLGTGQELFAESLPPIVLRTSGGNQRRISVHDSYSARLSRETDRDSTVIAVLQYFSGAQPARRATVHLPAGGNWTAMVLFFGGASTARDSVQHEIRGEAGKPVAISGATIVLVLESLMDVDAQPLRIEIPIVDDRLAIEQAHVPQGVRLAWAEASR